MSAENYINAVEKILSGTEKQRESVKKAAELIVNAIKGGRHVFVMDRYGLLDNELVGRAGTLAIFMKEDEFELNKPQKGDVAIVAAVFGDAKEDMQIIDDVRTRGALIITISPIGKLSQSADVAIINESSSNGVIETSGISVPFCPTSSISNAVLAWFLSAEIISLLYKEKKLPTVLCGKYINDGKKKFEELKKRYVSLGY